MRRDLKRRINAMSWREGEEREFRLYNNDS